MKCSIGGAGENKMAIMKTKNFILRFTEEELQTAKEKAAQAGMPLAAYIRALVSGAEVVAKVDVKAMKELSGLAGLFKHLYNEGADPQQTGRALKAIESVAASLAHRS